MLSVLSYEIPSLALSRFPANGMSSARIVFIAVLLYFAFRLAAGTSKQTFPASALAGAGGAALACLALSRFDVQFRAIQTAGFSDIVALRSRLIPLGPRWVLGEWFTLLLSTSPFAFAASMWLWTARRRAFAMAAAPMPVLVTAALLLSCSRSVFWSVLVFAVSGPAILAAYRVLRAKAALALLAVSLTIAGATLLVHNAAYPGIAGAYLHRQASQHPQHRRAVGRLEAIRRCLQDVAALGRRIRECSVVPDVIGGPRGNHGLCGQHLQPASAVAGGKGRHRRGSVSGRVGASRMGVAPQAAQSRGLASNEGADVLFGSRSGRGAVPGADVFLAAAARGNRHAVCYEPGSFHRRGIRMRPLTLGPVAIALALAAGAASPPSTIMTGRKPA